MNIWRFIYQLIMFLEMRLKWPMGSSSSAVDERHRVDIVDDEEIDLVVSGEDTTMPCSSPEASETLAAPPDFRDEHGPTSPVTSSSMYDTCDYHVDHDDDEDPCRLELLNDVTFSRYLPPSYHSFKKTFEWFEFNFNSILKESLYDVFQIFSRWSGIICKLAISSRLWMLRQSAVDWKYDLMGFHAMSRVGGGGSAIYGRHVQLPAGWCSSLPISD